MTTDARRAAALAAARAETDAATAARLEREARDRDALAARISDALGAAMMEHDYLAANLTVREFANLRGRLLSAVLDELK